MGLRARLAGFMAITVIPLVLVATASAQRPATPKELALFKQAEAKWFNAHGGSGHEFKGSASVSTVDSTWGADIVDGTGKKYGSVYSVHLRRTGARWTVVAMLPATGAVTNTRCGLPAAVGVDLYPSGKCVTWPPADYRLVPTNPRLAYRYYPGQATCSAGATCNGVYVISEDGCPSEVYAEENATVNGVVVDSSNAAIYSLAANQPALLVLNFYGLPAGAQPVMGQILCE